MRALWCLALFFPIGAQALGPVGPGLVILPGAEVEGGASYSLLDMNVGRTEGDVCVVTVDQRICERKRTVQQGDGNPLGLMSGASKAWVHVGNTKVHSEASVSLVATTGRGVEAAAAAGLTYRFQVVGPENAAVPIRMHYSGDATLDATWVGTLNPQALWFRPGTGQSPGGPGGPYVSAEWHVVPGESYNGSQQTVFSRFLNASDLDFGWGGGGENAWHMEWKVDDRPASFSVMANTTYTVRLRTHVDLPLLLFRDTDLDSANIKLSATADPYFDVDPTWANASQFSLAFSEGILNAAPVPEASTVAMWAAGLLAIGTAARRRRAAGLQDPTRIQ